MNRSRGCDSADMSPAVISFLNCLSATVVVYASITRGGKLVARVIERLATR